VNCPVVAGSQVFLPWGDSSFYVLAPGGGFESAAGWTFTGGAGPIAGNESYFVHSSADRTSLSIPAGGSATTPAFCIDQTTPTMRYFVLGPKSAGATLTVEASYVDSHGVAGWRTLDKVKTSGGWQAAKAFKLPTKIQSPNVQFRFSVSGGSGSYQLDDVYVDPYIRG